MSSTTASSDIAFLPTLANLGSSTASTAFTASELKTSKKMCNHPTCKVKLGLLDATMPCRCGHIFCGAHRFGHNANNETSHKCSFDYKAASTAILQNINKRVIADKIEKI